MITLTITVATNDELLALAQKLNGVSNVSVSAASEDKPAAAKASGKVTNKAAGEAATKSAAPAKSGKRVVTLEELQNKIGEHANGDTAKIKEFVASFGVKKVSLLDEKQLIQAFDGVEAYFSDEEGGEEENEDPMA